MPTADQFIKRSASIKQQKPRELKSQFNLVSNINYREQLGSYMNQKYPTNLVAAESQEPTT